jgi:hypothetical protein
MGRRALFIRRDIHCSQSESGVPTLLSAVSRQAPGVDRRQAARTARGGAVPDDGGAEGRGGGGVDSKSQLINDARAAWRDGKGISNQFEKESKHRRPP